MCTSSKIVALLSQDVWIEVFSCFITKSILHKVHGDPIIARTWVHFLDFQSIWWWNFLIKPHMYDHSCRRMQENFTIDIKPYHHVYQSDHNTTHKPIRCNERNHCWKLFFFQQLQHPTLANALLCNWEADYVFPCPHQPVHITWNPLDKMVSNS